jgi:SAM-dependent methyltransferase
VITSERAARPGREFRSRYSAGDLAVLTPEEASRFICEGAGDPRTNVTLAWELLYRLEPELYDRLATAERLHPDVIGWLPHAADRIVEVGAGPGRLTLELLDRGQQVVAIEPVAPFRRILRRKLAAAEHGYRARVIKGFFDDLPVASGVADLVVACSVLTPASAHGGEPGLAEMERVCRAGGCVAVIWPNNIDWLAARGYEYLSFAGPMSVQFASQREAVELAEIFYPDAVAEVRRRDSRQVPYEVLGINPPRDLAFKVMPR